MKTQITVSIFIFTLLLFTNKVTAIKENELIYNRTSNELINLLKNLSNSQYQTNISSITNKLGECYTLYCLTYPNNLFFLERLLREKMINITSTNNANIETHIRSIEEGLTYATKVTPNFFRRDALLILVQNPKLKLNRLVKLFQNVSTFAMNSDISIAQDVNSFTVIPSHPYLQKFLKDSTILFILFAALADICVDPAMTVCPVLVLVGIVASGLWVFQINNIFNGIL